MTYKHILGLLRTEKGSLVDFFLPLVETTVICEEQRSSPGFHEPLHSVMVKSWLFDKS